MNQEPLFDRTTPSRWSLNVIVGLHFFESMAQVIALVVLARWLELDLDVAPPWVLVALAYPPAT